MFVRAFNNISMQKLNRGWYRSVGLSGKQRLIVDWLRYVALPVSSFSIPPQTHEGHEIYGIRDNRTSLSS